MTDHPAAGAQLLKPPPPAREEIAAPAAVRRTRRLRPRSSRPTRPIVACWATSLGLGAATLFLLIAHAAGQGAPPSGLEPSTLTRYLQAIAGPGARDVRINGVYGSGQGGAWQFVAHLSWRTANGTLTSATAELPTQAEASQRDPTLTGARLADEQRIGWTLPQAQAALDHDASLDTAPLASLELQTSNSDSTLTTCQAGITPRGPAAGSQSTAVPATCLTQRLSRADVRFRDELTDSPYGGPLAVQRNGHRITD